MVRPSTSRRRGHSLVTAAGAAGMGAVGGGRSARRTSTGGLGLAAVGAPIAGWRQMGQVTTEDLRRAVAA